MEAWRFSGFYGEPDTTERMEAWNMLRMLNSKPHLPRVCMGDFNEILLSEEKRGGRVRTHCQMQAFRDALDTCGFMDLGFTSSEFIWQGVRNGQVIRERLDRRVANYDWMAKFPMATMHSASTLYLFRPSATFVATEPEW